MVFPQKTLEMLKIDAGTVLWAGHDETPALTLPNGDLISPLPPRTIVKLLLQPVQRSQINVEIWLPDAPHWNGRFLGLGNGGAAGHIDPCTLARGMEGGYAVATTDMGTAPDPLSGVGNPEVWKDFGFRATHLMTLAAKQVIEAFYGKPPLYSFFNGGSTGGQQALQEAQRYPEDYDGIFANVPAHCRTPLHAYFLWNAQILHRCPFTKEQQGHAIATANEFMAVRETPVTAGKIVSDPRCSAEEIDAVVRLAREKDPTLTQAHAEALRLLWDGPRHAVTGERIFGGIPLGSCFDSACGNLYLFHWVFGAHRNLMDLNFANDIDTYTAALGPYLNAENSDLSRFAARGGKILLMSGSADDCVPYHATLDYYERVVERAGGLEQAQAFCRFFIAPGMTHALEAGPGVNAVVSPFKAVVAWRENGIAPDRIESSRVINGKTEWTMPLFPYPGRTGWDAEAGCFKRIDGPRGGVERVAERFRPAAAE